MMLNIVDRKQKKKKKKSKKKSKLQQEVAAPEAAIVTTEENRKQKRQRDGSAQQASKAARREGGGSAGRNRDEDDQSGKKAEAALSKSNGGGDDDAEPVTFKSLGLVDVLCKACESVKWPAPTPIQAEAIPPGLEGRDIIGVAETGSGKTGAFVLPVLNALLQTPTRLFCLVLAPTRELAFQIAETFEALGSIIDLKCATVVGGVDNMAQAIALAKKPHVVVATPGRLVDHLENTKGFNLRSVKYLILDEADRMLSMDFEEEINQILEVIPRSRTTFLFSATMTTKVAKLQRAAMRDPVKVQVNSKYQTVKTLIQRYLFIPEKYKDCYLVYILNEFAGQTALIFTKTCNECERLTHLLRNLGFEAICLHGKMNQASRLGALAQFKSQSSSILLATDVASRGLDIPSVDIVCNFSIPSNVKDYVHRVGRTARAGRSGRALNFVTQYDVEDYQRIEKHINQKLEQFPVNQEEVVVMLERVTEAQRFAITQMKEIHSKEKEGKRRGSKHSFKRKNKH